MAASRPSPPESLGPLNTGQARESQVLTMRQYTIASTMKHDAGDGKGEQTYGTEIQVEGPDTLEEFQNALGINGVLSVLADAFESDQVSILRGRLAKKLGKEKSGGGRIANAVRVDLDE